jgi:hypothetical protein
MVRAVEPEPADSLRRVDSKVKPPNAKPDKLAYQRVAEHGRRSREQPRHDSGHRLDADEVTLEQVPSSETGEVEPPSADAAPDVDHLDVEG